ncbi:MAG: dihydroorotate dehydrogenase, partial [Paracoccaceae bacterium]
MSDQILEDLFGVARAAAPAPSAGLMARVLADAYEAQPLPAPAAPAAAVTRPGWRLLLAAMVDGLGGAGAVAG